MEVASLLGWESETVVDFLNDFMHLMLYHTQAYFPESYLSKSIQKDPNNRKYYKKLIATLPEEERKQARLFRSNRKPTWRLLSIDLPALMWQTVKMRCAEKREDGDYAKMAETGSWDDYFDLKVKEDPNPRTLRFN